LKVSKSNRKLIKNDFNENFYNDTVDIRDVNGYSCPEGDTVVTHKTAARRYLEGVILKYLHNLQWDLKCTSKSKVPEVIILSPLSANSFTFQSI